ncbi:12340_t:CDS:2 [Acaulospora morrowiae]|uniref:12340_t:CDS:1 n=1 Tax=Acaulospora morrowiae TaxID=94023 RepID=A0A9N8W8L2_9GLOM|nr:12340_t:CDS:2 [Acaulospora morrowiae]
MSYVQTEHDAISSLYALRFFGVNSQVSNFSVMDNFYAQLTSLKFPSAKEAASFCRQLAREFGFTIKQETSSNKNVYVYCSREGISESVKVGREAKRKRISLRCDCKWRVVLYKNEQEGDQWVFRKSVNPQHSEHNHDLIPPEHLPTPWPPNVLQRIADHANSDLSTGDIRNAIQQEFPDLLWDERRFYNRLAEERKKKKVRDTEQRVANTIFLAARLASLACSNQEYTDKVYAILNNAFEDICKSAKIDPSSVYKENSSTQGDMTVITTSTSSNSDIICNYPAGTITVKNIPGQKGRPSKKNAQLTSSPLQSRYQRETSAASSTSDSSAQSPLHYGQLLPKRTERASLSHPNERSSTQLHEFRPNVQPQKGMVPSPLNFQGGLANVMLPPQSQLPSSAPSHLHIPSNSQECVHQEGTQSSHLPTDSLSSSQLQIPFPSQPIPFPYSQANPPEIQEETNFKCHSNQLDSQMLSVPPQQFPPQLSLPQQKISPQVSSHSHPTSYQFSDGDIQFQRQLSIVRKEPSLKVENMAVESVSALEQAKEISKAAVIEHLARFHNVNRIQISPASRSKRTSIGKGERDGDLAKMEQRTQQQVTHVEPVKSHNETDPESSHRFEIPTTFDNGIKSDVSSLNMFLRSATKISNFAGAENISKIVNNSDLNNEVTIVDVNARLDPSAATAYNSSVSTLPTTVSFDNGDDNFNNPSIYHTASQRIFTQPLVPMNWMQNYQPNHMTWYSDDISN